MDFVISLYSIALANMEAKKAAASLQDLVDGFDTLWREIEKIRSRNEEIQDFLRCLHSQVGLVLPFPLLLM